MSDQIRTTKCGRYEIDGVNGGPPQTFENEADAKLALQLRPGWPISITEIVPGALFVHRKTGKLYEIVMIALIEVTVTPAVAYRRANDPAGAVWIRPLSEFADGRFMKWLP